MSTACNKPLHGSSDGDIATKGSSAHDSAEEVQHVKHSIIAHLYKESLEQCSTQHDVHAAVCNDQRSVVGYLSAETENNADSQEPAQTMSDTGSGSKVSEAPDLLQNFNEAADQELGLNIGSAVSCEAKARCARSDDSAAQGRKTTRQLHEHVVGDAKKIEVKGQFACSDRCAATGTRFGLTVRRHHCRWCLKSFIHEHCMPCAVTVGRSARIVHFSDEGCAGVWHNGHEMHGITCTSEAKGHTQAKRLCQDCHVVILYTLRNDAPRSMRHLKLPPAMALPVYLKVTHCQLQSRQIVAAARVAKLQ